MPEIKGQSDIKVGSNGTRVILDVTGPSGHRIVAQLDRDQYFKLMGSLIHAKDLTKFPEREIAAPVTENGQNTSGGAYDD